MPVFLTTVEAANLVRMAPSTLERFRVVGGGPPYFKVGGKRNAKVLYDRRELIAWVASSRYQNTGEYE